MRRAGHVRRISEAKVTDPGAQEPEPSAEPTWAREQGRRRAGKRPIIVAGYVSIRRRQCLRADPETS
jgi:hypothetical protein